MLNMKKFLLGLLELDEGADYLDERTGKPVQVLRPQPFPDLVRVSMKYGMNGEGKIL